MDMEGSRALAVTQQQAWDALNDPEVLKTSIPGCDRIEKTGDNQYVVVVAVKIGPVQAKFNGKLALSDVKPPESYTITFDGQGGVAGFGKGVSHVKLSPQAGGPGCLLEYKVQAQVGGKIAQLGQRLIDGVAKSMAEDFFKRFDAEMERVHPEAYAARAAAADVIAEAAGGLAGQPAAALATAQGATVPSWVWIAIAAALALGVVLWMSR
jgi:carbon monoxide dehydrogenase subunit G